MRRKDRELTDKKDLLSILDEADVCRIAIQTGKAPYIVPLNFGYAWDEKLVLYFHSATEGRKLELLKKNNSVGFELDTGHELVAADLACNWGMKYRSIIGTGRVSFMEDDAEKAVALSIIMQKYRPVSSAGTTSLAGKGGSAGTSGATEFSVPNLRSVKVFSLKVEDLTGKQKK